MMVLCLVLLLVVFVLMLLTLDRCHLRRFRSEFYEISALFLLMSYETIGGREEMKSIFNGRIDDYEALE